MVYQTFADYLAAHGSGGGLAGIFLYVAHLLPFFIPLTLFVFFVVIAMAVYSTSRLMTGRGNMASACAAAGYATSMLAFSMSLVSGLINIETIIITILVAVACTAWLYLARD